MSSFSLNLSEIKNNISNSKKNLKDYDEDLNIYLNSVLNIDGAWNDKNTNGFINIVKKDRADLNQYIDSLNAYLNIIDGFCQGLNNIIIYNFNIKKLNKIKYDLDKLDVLITTTQQINDLVNSNYEILNSAIIPSSFKYYTELKQIENKYLNYKQKVSEFLKRLEDIKNRVELLIYNTKVKIKNFDVKYISKNICQHKYKIVSAAIKNNNI